MVNKFVVVSGATGFLGSKWIELYGNRFERVVGLTTGTRLCNTEKESDSKENNKYSSKGNVKYKKVLMDDYNGLLDISKGCDVFVHFAFDHSYESNICGIRNVVKVCGINKIKKLIHISSISVYNLENTDEVNENSSYSRLHDPYTYAKRKIELILNRVAPERLKVIILQPTIVFGLGGNWTNYAFGACKTKDLSLPGNGERECNCVYVNDVAQAVYQSIEENNIASNKETFLISGEDRIKWSDFYQGHARVLADLGFPANLKITSSSKREFHDNYLLNFIFKIWFKSLVGMLFNIFVKWLLKLTSGKSKLAGNNMEVMNFLTKGFIDEHLSPWGMSRKIHNGEFVVNCEKAKKILGYETDFSFQEGLVDLKNCIKQIGTQY